jgi:hypothetical protein
VNGILYGWLQDDFSENTNDYTRIDTHNVIQILLGAHVSGGIDKETQFDY